LKAKTHSADADIQASYAALKRAAKAARKLSEATATPFYVVRRGRIVNINAARKVRKTA
jgi:hypothetical protein